MAAKVMVQQRVKRFVMNLFLTYIVTLLYATLFTYNYYIYGKSVNLIAFDSIKLMFSSGNLWLIIKNIFGNVLLFVPLGFFLPLIIIKLRRLIIVFMIGFISSCLIELCQYFFAERIFDVDDILLNTLGACVGYAFFRLLYSGYRLVKRNI